MSRADSASLYGSGTPLNLARVNATAPRRPHGLRSESSPDGWYAGPRTPYKPRPRRNGPVVSNKPDAATLRAQREQARADRLAAEYEAECRGHEMRRAAGIVGDTDS